MTDSASSESSLRDEFVATQELLMHMQHELEQIHEVALAQQKQIDALTRAQKRLEQRIEETGSSSDMPSPLEERPPHY